MLVLEVLESVMVLECLTICGYIIKIIVRATAILVWLPLCFLHIVLGLMNLRRLIVTQLTRLRRVFRSPKRWQIRRLSWWVSMVVWRNDCRLHVLVCHFWLILLPFHFFKRFCIKKLLLFELGDDRVILRTTFETGSDFFLWGHATGPWWLLWLDDPLCIWSTFSLIL